MEAGGDRGTRVRGGLPGGWVRRRLTKMVTRTTDRETSSRLGTSQVLTPSQAWGTWNKQVRIVAGAVITCFYSDKTEALKTTGQVWVGSREKSFRELSSELRGPIRGLVGLETPQLLSPALGLPGAHLPWVPAVPAAAGV